MSDRNTIGDAAVAVGFALVADFGIEERREERREIAGFAMPEQQFLRTDRTRRKHGKPVPGAVPFAQGDRGIRMDMPAEIPALVALAPDHALQRLERGVLAILVDPALQRLGNDLVAADAAALGRHHVEPTPDVGIARMRAHETGKRAPRIREQHVLDERNAAGRAFDVGEDRGCHGSLAWGASCGGHAYASRTPWIQSGRPGS